MKIITGLTESEVYNTFGTTYATRGDAYVRARRVRNCQLDVEGQCLIGKVQGSRAKPYNVRLELNRTLSKIYTHSCSCPMGGLCKHAAALALHAIYQGVFPRLNTLDDSPPPSSTNQKLQKVPTAPEHSSQHKPLRAELSKWVNNLTTSITEAKSEAASAESAKTTRPAQTDSILYILEAVHGRLAMYCLRSRRLKSGAWGGTQQAHIPTIAQNRAQYVTPEDATICASFAGARTIGGWHYTQLFPEKPAVSVLLIEQIIATGRCFWEKVEQPISTLGPAREARLRWDLLNDGSQILKVSADSGDDIVVIAGGIWYVNPIQGELGPLVTDLSPDTVQCILQMPRVKQEETAPLSEAMERAGLEIPRPIAKYKIKTELVKPKPKLLLRSEDYSDWDVDPETQISTLSELHFDYGDIKFEYDNNQESRTISGDQILVQRKDLDSERRFFELVSKHDLGEAFLKSSKQPNVVVFENFVDDDETWLKFVQKGIPELVAEGFTVETDGSFKYKISTADDDWDVDATSGAGFWFSLDLGVLVDGKRVPLFPIIHKAIKHLHGLSPSLEIDHLNIDGKFYAPLPEGGFVALPFERVKAVVFTLLEIFDPRTPPDGPAAQVNLPQIMQLAPHLTAATAGDACRLCSSA